MFFISGLVSLLIISLFFYFFFNYAKEGKKYKKRLYFTIAGVFILINFLYFTNTIPPIPLIMKEAGVYHSVEKVEDNYRVVTEECQSWDQCFFTGEVRHINNYPQPIYFYSAVYSPPEMNLEVVHKWQKYSKTEERWEIKAEIPFYLRGGSDFGFRWYSYYSVTPGFWEVLVETSSGRIVGRESFYIKEGSREKVAKDI
jgi:energy-coupling factor transporter transmembrane protein EcfT